MVITLKDGRNSHSSSFDRWLAFPFQRKTMYIYIYIETKRVTKKYTHQLISFYIYVKRGRENIANKYLYIEKRVLEWKTNNEQEHIHLQWIIDLS